MQRLSRSGKSAGYNSMQYHGYPPEDAAGLGCPGPGECAAITSRPARRNGRTRSFSPPASRTLREEILTDMTNICQGTASGADAGAGNRLRRGSGDARLSKVFGEVHGVDVSGEMVRRAKDGSGGPAERFRVPEQRKRPFRIAGGSAFDFAFSGIVFQHIPSREVIESYVARGSCAACVRELYSNFRCRATARSKLNPTTPGWEFRSPISRRWRWHYSCGFDPRYRHGAGEQYFWLWFFKK